VANFPQREIGENLEAAPGFEPGMKDLQSSALPLGYAASKSHFPADSWLLSRPAGNSGLPNGAKHGQFPETCGGRKDSLLLMELFAGDQAAYSISSSRSYT
jgi:hypothetical protein